jgi:hypothetical protein
VELEPFVRYRAQLTVLANPELDVAAVIADLDVDNLPCERRSAYGTSRLAIA